MELLPELRGEDGGQTMTFLAGLALGFIIGVMTIIVIALALANKKH
jgi:hypothetical protein